MKTAEAIKCGDGLIQDIPFKSFLMDNSLYDDSSLFIISEIIYYLVKVRIIDKPFSIQLRI